MRLDRRVLAVRAKVGAVRSYGPRNEGGPVDMWKSRYRWLRWFKRRGSDFPTCPPGATTIYAELECQVKIPLKSAKNPR